MKKGNEKTIKFKNNAVQFVHFDCVIGLTKKPYLKTFVWQ